MGRGISGLPRRPAVSSWGPGLTTLGGASSTAVWSSSCLERRSPAKRMHRSWNATDPLRHCHERAAVESGGHGKYEECPDALERSGAEAEVGV